jgi:uncharacterized protein YyaL (SSP411 family)
MSSLRQVCEACAMNQLANSDSLYLRQHADNPVHWWPWSEAALAEARRRDCPILLSIGYAACHWCHVMAHENFADADTAAAMNMQYVCIKLDREQRPDLDRAYQRAQQALNGRPGGWPLTAFLDPRTLLPIFIGTYFPPTPRHGLPAFRQVLDGIAMAWREQRDAITQQGAQWHGWLAASEVAPASADMELSDPLTHALTQIEARFDAEHGGHRGAPKFPQASELELLLDLAEADPPESEAARRMLVVTLDGMARGGLHDHVGGGFFRYCVDVDWGIPHFEKMLYDNAQLLPVYARAAALLQCDDYARVARLGADWLQREMRLDSGAWASALDADSPGGEGAYYVWTLTTLADALPDSALRAQAGHDFGLDRAPNFEGHAWHLRLADSATLVPADIAGENIRHGLLHARRQRPAPARDDKALTAWNALAIAGLCRAARALRAPDLLPAAEDALAALRAGAWRNGVLYAQAGSAGSAPGFLDDHAYLLDALLELLTWRWRDDDLTWAQALAAILCDQFADATHGGFYFSTTAHATPLGRERGFEDSSQPSGNAIAASALLRLGHLCGESRWVDAAARAIQAGHVALAEYPAAAPSLLRAWRAWQQPEAQLIVRVSAQEQPGWATALALAPTSLHTYVIPVDAVGLPPALAARAAVPGGVAYLCAEFTCQAPITRPEQLIAALGAASH